MLRAPVLAAACCLLVATGADAAATAAARYPAAVSFRDARHGLAIVESRGLGVRWVEMTSDGGVHWRALSRIDLWTLDAVAGSRTVWAATRRAVVVSGDGGRHWQTARDGAVVALSFATPRDGWIVTGNSTSHRGPRLLATHDGGRTWSSVRVPCSHSGWPGAVALVTARGWLVCVGEPGAGEQGKEIWSTVDGGGTWRLHARVGLSGPHTTVGDFPVTGYPLGAAAAGDQLWVWEERGGLEESRDGTLWRVDPVTVPETREAVSVSLVTRRLAFAIVGAPAGDPGTLVRTTDGGRTWTTISHWR